VVDDGVVGKPELSFALTWQRNTEPVGAAASKLLRWLGGRVGATIVPRVALSYEEILPLFERREVDFAWLPPIVFLMLRKNDLARTLLVNERHGDTAFCAVLAVHSSSRHYSLDRLRGARAAWVDPHSATGYVLQRIDLAARGVDPKTTFAEDRFLGSHDAAARAVFEGRSDVLGTFALYDGDRIVRAGFSSQGSASEWRIVLRGREAPSDVLAARSNIDPDLAAAIRDALSAATDDPVAGPLLREAFHINQFAAADDDRYAALAEALATAQRDGLLPHL
jgi:phosphonate transport system substrate-binding protein